MARKTQNNKNNNDRKPDVIINNIPVFHWDQETQEYSDISAAAKWTWSTLRKLSFVFCKAHCMRHQCSIGEVDTETSDLILKQEISDCESSEDRGSSWLNVQEELHKAFAYLPSHQELADECPACSIVKAFAQFPTLFKHSPVSPVAVVKMNGIDCYPDVVYQGRIQEHSIPCCIVETTVGDGFETETESMIREYALLNLDFNKLPALPPWDLANIKENIEPGKKVVEFLELLCDSEKRHHMIQQNLPTVITASTALQELLRAKYFYPDDIDESEFRKLFGELIYYLELSLEHPAFIPYISLYKRPEYEDINAASNIAMFKAIFISLHSEFKICTTEEMIKNAKKIIDICQENALEPVKKIASRIIEIIMFDCKIPHPVDVPEYQDNKRFLHLLREYWGLCRRLISDQQQGLVYYIPHPLTPLILSLKKRIDICFEQLTDLQDNNDAKKSFNDLINILLSSEPDALSVVDEWTGDQIQCVDMFIENSRMRNGTKTFDLTHAEKLCIDQGNREIIDYLEKAKKDWTEMHSGERRTVPKSKTDIETDTQEKESVQKKAKETMPAVNKTHSPITEKEGFYCKDVFHFDGRQEKGRTFIKINDREMSMANREFEILFQLAVQLVKDGKGWVRGSDVSRDSVWQCFSRVRNKLQGYLIVDTQDIIENDRSGKYRLSVPPSNISFNSEAISQHENKSLQIMFEKLNIE